ncbi:MAG: hypothetical protein EPN84_06555 [Legionella sp.]|nr:MAG: hypothetical protein EPN84_06555 [Legionella sp.]
MLTKHASYLSALVFTLSANAYSATYAIGDTQTIDLYPAIYEELNNPTANAINAQCEVRLAKDEHHSILIRMIEGSGSFNGRVQTAGQAYWQSFYKTETLQISINANTSFRLTNHGYFPIRIVCRTQ